MDNFICKLNNILDYRGEENIFHIFKSETLYFLNDNNLKNVDYKSVGSLFGMNYNQDSIKNIDILVKLEYDFYILKKFIKDLLEFYCKRKKLTNKTYIEIIKSYAFDEYELIKSINKQNEKNKFKLLQKKIWQPLYYYEQNSNKIKNNYKLNNTDIIDNTNIIDNNNNKMLDDDSWRNINKKKTYKYIKYINTNDDNENNENNEDNNNEDNDNDIILSNNKFNKLINDNDEENEEENEEEEEEDIAIKEIKKIDKKKFSEYKIYNKDDLEFIQIKEQLENSEKNIDKIINNITSEVKMYWADMIESD